MSTGKPKKLKNTSSVLIIGIPGPGLIGTLSLSYIIHSLNMEIIGEIEHPDISNVIFIDNGNLAGPIRLYKKGSVFAALSDIPIDYIIARGFTESIIDFCKKNKIDMVMVLSGLQAVERNAANLKTYGLVTNERLERILYENEIPKFLSGIIAGPDATILTILKNSSVPTLVLYTECNFFFPDPEAAINTIKTISRILNIEIDITEFKKQIDFLRLQSRQLMEETLTILHPEKTPTMPAPQIYK
jgi:uncharacterized protein